MHTHYLTNRHKWTDIRWGGGERGREEKRERERGRKGEGERGNFFQRLPSSILEPKTEEEDTIRIRRWNVEIHKTS
jgi:hypothetical protein